MTTMSPRRNSSTCARASAREASLQCSGSRAGGVWAIVGTRVVVACPQPPSTSRSRTTPERRTPGGSQRSALEAPRAPVHLEPDAEALSGALAAPARRKLVEQPHAEAVLAVVVTVEPRA